MNIKKSIVQNIKQISKSLKSIFDVVKLVWKSSKWVTSLIFMVSILEGVLLPLDMVISKYFIDSVVDTLANGYSGARNQIFIWLLLQLAFAVLSKILNQLNEYLCNVQEKLLNIYITDLILEKVNQLDLSYFEDPEFYDKIEKSNSEFADRAIATLETIVQMLKNLTSLSGAIAIVLMLNPIIIIISLFTTIPMFYANLNISQKKYNIFNERVHEVRFAWCLQRDFINYNFIKEIKLNRLGNYFKNIILSIYNKHFEQDKVIGKQQIRDLTIIDIINNIVSYAFKLYVVYITIMRGLTIGSMTMYIAALVNMDQSIRGILNSFAYIHSNSLYTDNLFSVLNLNSKIHNDSNLPSFDNTIIKSIEFRNVSFKYPNTEKYVLRNIDLEIKAGQTCALVGLNGSGKTTLVKLLARLYDPDEGAIYIDGKDIKEYNVETLYKNINIVFQDFMKYPFTVKQNIGFGNIEKSEDIELIKYAAEKSGAAEFIEGLPEKYDTKLDKMWSGGVELSLGQWQKLAISRAFMSDASILILDEPTASLDAKSEYELFQNFKELTQNTTCMLISHRFSTVKMADLICVIENGAIVESGDHSCLMQYNGLYAKLFNMQAEAYASESVDLSEVAN